MKILALLSTALVLIVVFNLVATRRVFKSDLYEAKQKYIQYAVIWLIPVLGAGIALAVSGQPDIPKRRQKSTDTLEAFDNYGMSGADSGDGGHVGGHH